jgi:TolB-like protein
VLPLENLSGDASQDYFSDGMTDELITELGQISELRVISRTSTMIYKGAHASLPQIARDLNVEAVVEGAVLRSGNRVRITAQLIQAATDKHLWARSYDGEIGDTLALQKQVARSIAAEIRIELTPYEQAVSAKQARRRVSGEGPSTAASSTWLFVGCGDKRVRLRNCTTAHGRARSAARRCLVVASPLPSGAFRRITLYQVVFERLCARVRRYESSEAFLDRDHRSGEIVGRPWCFAGEVLEHRIEHAKPLLRDAPRLLQALPLRREDLLRAFGCPSVRLAHLGFLGLAFAELVLGGPRRCARLVERSTKRAGPRLGLREVPRCPICAFAVHAASPGFPDYLGRIGRQNVLPVGARDEEFGYRVRDLTPYVRKTKRSSLRPPVAVTIRSCTEI